jgi:hypothetical protein
LFSRSANLKRAICRRFCSPNTTMLAVLPMHGNESVCLVMLTPASVLLLGAGCTWRDGDYWSWRRCCNRNLDLSRYCNLRRCCTNWCLCRGCRTWSRLLI